MIWIWFENERKSHADILVNCMYYSGKNIVGFSIILTLIVKKRFDAVIVA